MDENMYNELEMQADVETAIADKNAESTEKKITKRKTKQEVALNKKAKLELKRQKMLLELEELDKQDNALDDIIKNANTVKDKRSQRNHRLYLFAGNYEKLVGAGTADELMSFILNKVFVLTGEQLTKFFAKHKEDVLVQRYEAIEQAKAEGKTVIETQEDRIVTFKDMLFYLYNNEAVKEEYKQSVKNDKKELEAKILAEAKRKAEEAMNAYKALLNSTK